MLVARSSTSTVQGSEEENHECPPWFWYNSNITFSNSPPPFIHCVCHTLLPSLIKCDFQGYTSKLAIGKCAFWTNDTWRKNGITVVGECPYAFPKHLYIDHVIKLPQDVHSLNDFLCDSLNRETGRRLCGKCTNGTGPSVTSVGSQCAKCSPVNVLYIILLYYLPATLIFLFILIVQPNTISGSIAYYILYCNALAVYMQMPGGFPTYLALNQYKFTFMRIILVLNSILSFDPLYFLSPPLCISSHLEDMHLLYIEVLKTLYPFLLLLLALAGIELYGRDCRPVVTLWRPIQKLLFRLKSTWDPHASLVQAFSTVFFISYVKLMFLASIPFNWIDFMNEYGTIEYRVTFIDPTVPVLHSKHVYLIACSVVVVSVIILPPIVVLMLYPTRLFTKLQNCLPPRVNLAVKIFVSPFQGSYKDGTNGTWDYRAFPGGLFFAIFALILIHYLSMSIKISERQPVLSWEVLIVLAITLVVLVSSMRPHTSEITNNVAVCLIGMLGIGATVHVSIETYFTANIEVITAALLVLCVPHVVFYCYLAYQIWMRLDITRAVRRLCCRVSSAGTEGERILQEP